tara:strand:- start:46 stop:228 length:183 start_codon:yes stop_codon:yes gene_type:complete
MLEFSKIVLQKVSFDHLLFKKELSKSIKWMNKNDLKDFRKWCLKMFGTRYAKTIHKAFEA